MSTRILRLEHAELCTSCADLLPTGAVVVVDEGCRVTCRSCIGTRFHLAEVGPWTLIDDPELRSRLEHRVLASA